MDGRRRSCADAIRHMKGRAMSSRFPAWQPRLHARPVQRRAVLLSGLALPVGLLAAKATPAAALQRAARQPACAAQLTLPAPTGHYRLGTVSLDLIDFSRPDPWVPAIPFRELIVQFTYPAVEVDRYPRAPYFTDVLARAYEKYADIPVALNWPVTHAHAGAPVRQREGGWPVVLYSPGLGDERNDTTCIVEDLASRGYVVVTIDHVHDSGVVELPDGRVETTAVPPPPPDDNPQTTKEIDARAADVSFVLDSLAVISRGGNPGHERRPLPAGLHRALDLSRVGMFGHSDGGSTAAHVLHTDARLKAGISMDGTLYTPQAVAGSSRPLLLFGRQDLDSFEAATWDEFWQRQRGPKLQLSLLDSTHASFTDFAALVPQAACILGEPQKWVNDFVGTIGERAVAVERAYLAAWFDRYLRHHPSDLLTGPSARYPEVVFAR
jgi:dienelactone hydrolase